jgi:hypothetical protein
MSDRTLPRIIIDMVSTWWKPYTWSIWNTEEHRVVQDTQLRYNTIAEAQAAAEAMLSRCGHTSDVVDAINSAEANQASAVKRDAISQARQEVLAAVAAMVTSHEEHDGKVYNQLMLVISLGKKLQLMQSDINP